MSFMGVPQFVVLNTFAEAATERSGRGFHDHCYETHLYLLDFKDESAINGKRAAPAFDHDEYGAMAIYVLSQGLENLTAASTKEFFIDDKPIPAHHIDSFIQFYLEASNILDRVRNLPVNVSNRLVAEVRAAIARKRPRFSAPEDQSKIGRASHCSFYEELGSRVFLFADENLVLDAGAWTPSETLWTAWVHRCADRFEQPGEGPLFFKELVRWTGGRIQRRKKLSGGVRPPGYAGLKFSAAPR